MKKRIDHTRGLCGKPDIPDGTPLEEARKNPPHCLCCGSTMKVIADGGSLEQLGVYVVLCPTCPKEEK